jgi:Co/Zn/Cd efflux system component
LRKARGVALTSRSKLILEIVIPSFSVVALLCITAYILSDAIDLLTELEEGHEDVNLTYLFGFGAANILVDGLSCYMFLCQRDRYDSMFAICRGQYIGPVKTHQATPLQEPSPAPSVSVPALLSSKHPAPCTGIDANANADDDDDLKLFVDLEYLATEEEQEQEIVEIVPASGDIVPVGINNGANSKANASAGKATVNLNMVSAFTHLCADTVRTSSLLITAIISTATGLRSDQCDAWAAVIVSICIVIFTIPLIHDITKTLLARIQAGDE